MSENTAVQILKKYWGYDSFRKPQTEIISSISAGKDTLALLPTGGGKSICFQVPALMQEGICLVISPLIALMQDQVNRLKDLGIRALAVHAGMSKKEVDIALDNAAYGNYKFLYLSPERLKTELFLARLEKMNVSFIAIDEAHCISQWGYDFRPAYLAISEIRKLLPNCPLLALTATATPLVVKDIQDKLAFTKPNVIRLSFERKNLSYVVKTTEDPMGQILKIITAIKGAGIIYVNSRRRCKEVAKFLRENHLKADFYHAGLASKEREQKQNHWIKSEDGIIVSTNAFGMGIDKANVRWVIHLDAPQSIEAYFQEAGRAGRNGEKAYGVLLKQEDSINKLKQVLDQEFPSIKTIKACYQALCNYLKVPIGAGQEQTFPIDLSDFCHQFQLDLFETYKCLQFLEKDEYISLSENYDQSSKILFIQNKEDLYKFQVSHPKSDHFIKLLLRTYGGIFENYIRIDERKLAEIAKTSKAQIIEQLNFLAKNDLIDYIPQSQHPKISFTHSRVEQKSLIISAENYRELKKRKEEKINAMIAYLSNEKRCRSTYLLDYFGEKDAKICGKCDVCLADKKKLNQDEFNTLQNEILALLKKKSLFVHEIGNHLPSYSESDVSKVLSFLEGEEIIEMLNYKFQLR